MIDYRIMKDLSRLYPHWEERIETPNFSQAGRVHDWRNYVSSSIIESWDGLSQDAKVCVFLVASKIADSEEWE